MNVPKFAFEKMPLVIGASLCVLLIGEGYSRLPFTPKRLEYQPDRDIVGLLKPNQQGYESLANLSKRSPLATINSEGHRGGETSWDHAAIVALGSSEAFGMGVRDREVWTTVLEDGLTERGHDIEVVNAAGLGFGAYHQAAVMERLLDHRSPNGFIVSLSIGERYFEGIPEDSRDAAHQACSLAGDPASYHLHRFSTRISLSSVDTTSLEAGKRLGPWFRPIRWSAISVRPWRLEIVSTGRRWPT